MDAHLLSTDKHLQKMATWAESELDQVGAQMVSKPGDVNSWLSDIESHLHTEEARLQAMEAWQLRSNTMEAPPIME